MTETTDLTATSSFIYSELVNAETLNNTAKDLGSSTFSAFEDNTEYAVDALNQITADLVTKGILNIGNRCKVSISGSKISIASGVCVFGDGSKVRIETSATVNFISGYTNYVYFVKTTDNRILLYNSKTKITDEVSSNYCVKLAEISSDKVASDKREYAKAKHANLGGVNFESDEITVVLTFPKGDEKLQEVEKPFENYTCSSQEVSVGYGGYNYLHAENDEDSDKFDVRIADDGIKEVYKGSWWRAWVQKSGTYIKITAGTWLEHSAHEVKLKIKLY